MTINLHLKKEQDLVSVFLCKALTDLNLGVCLGGGQTFSWRNLGGTWVGCLGGFPVVLEELGGFIHFYTIPTAVEHVHGLLRRYFRLDQDLPGLYEEWSKRDPRYFAPAAKDFPGIRLLDQCPVETLFAFICSQNNTIKRILGMVHLLKSEYGSLVANVQMGGGEVIPIYDFPPAPVLAQDGVEERLRALGFGYRAGYIAKAAKQLSQAAPQQSVSHLRNLTYPLARDWLMEVPGIGPKVADCICLMSLNMQQVVPIDTHIWKVATSKYQMAPKSSNFSPKTYRILGERFEEIFGCQAGWAHLILFASQRRSGNK